MKLQHIFFIIMGVWTIDFLITIIALNYFGLSEFNKISNYFYSYGIMGYIVVFIFACFILWILSWVIWKYSNYKSNKDSKYIVFIPLGLFVLIEIIVIIHNFWLCWSVK